MTIEQADEPSPRKPLRLWPGAVLAGLQGLVMLGVPLVVPDGYILGLLGGLVGALAIFVWWLFFSRAPWLERLGAIVLMIVAQAATRRIIDESIATGMRGMMFVFYPIPVMSLALVAWAAASRRFPVGLRRASMVATIVLASGVWALLRTDGIMGDGSAQLAWRWAPTPEQRLVAEAREGPAPLPPAVATKAEPLEEQPTARNSVEPKAAISPAPAAEETPAEWPGFRGPDRDSVIHGVRIDTDWSRSPPVELWRRPIGPGWSSFAVRGDRIYTEEQRGEDEVVSCYSATSGEPVWMHKDAARFWESNGGAGPRGTPAISGARVYALGATGILNALEAGTGTVVWSRDTRSDTGVKVPYWGFASSPLVVDDLVIVATAGRLVAYDLATGEPRWFGPTHGASYSSPHRLTIDGVPQILLLSDAGATSVSPRGKVLWEHAWPGATLLQPALTSDGDVLMAANTATGGIGTRRLAVKHGPGGWKVEERWTSAGLKPYFNDFVVHRGHAFGFDGRILACIDLADGTRKWKGGRYGNGQLILLADQDLLLVVSEEGELALVAATPNEFTELARLPAIEGKTWNHPVLAGDRLLVRNGQEMAAFRLRRTAN